jgi:hypothetical protein
MFNHQCRATLVLNYANVCINTKTTAMCVGLQAFSRIAFGRCLYLGDKDVRVSGPYQTIVLIYVTLQQD